MYIEILFVVIFEYIYVSFFTNLFWNAQGCLKIVFIFRNIFLFVLFLCSQVSSTLFPVSILTKIVEVNVSALGLERWLKRQVLAALAYGPKSESLAVTYMLHVCRPRTVEQKSSHLSQNGEFHLQYETLSQKIHGRATKEYI